jgi:hypothetical protein
MIDAEGKVVWQAPAPAVPVTVDKPERIVNEPALPQANDAARSSSRTAQIVSGKWRVEGNELVKLDAGEEGEIRFGDPSWSNYYVGK